MYGKNYIQNSHQNTIKSHKNMKINVKQLVEELNYGNPSIISLRMCFLDICIQTIKIRA
jgi:hypothetical protein